MLRYPNSSFEIPISGKALLHGILILVGTLVALPLAWVLVFGLYHGSVMHPKIKPLAANPKAEAVRAARSLKYVLYDQAQGELHNIGGRVGMTVCIDVPRIAYASAGVDMDRLLLDDYKVHGALYQQELGLNNPQTPFFVRRVRNLLVYCKANNRLIADCAKPEPGDLIFPTPNHVAMVTESHADGTFNFIENDPDLLWVTETADEDWTPTDVCRLLPQ